MSAHDELPSFPRPDGPALLYVTSDGESMWVVDGDQLDVTKLSAREKAICVSLIEHSVVRLRETPEANTGNSEFGFHGGSGGLQSAAWSPSTPRPIDGR